MIMPIRPNVPDKKAGIEIFNSLRYGRFRSGIFAYIWQLISRYVPTPAARAAIKINILRPTILYHYYQMWSYYRL